MERWKQAPSHCSGHKIKIRVASYEIRKRFLEKKQHLYIPLRQKYEVVCWAKWSLADMLPQDLQTSSQGTDLLLRRQDLLFKLLNGTGCKPGPSGPSGRLCPMASMAPCKLCLILSDEVCRQARELHEK